MSAIQLTPSLSAIQTRAQLVKNIKSSLVEAFEDQLPSLRGNVQLITEILMSIESMQFPLKTSDEKDVLFTEVYVSIFGAMHDIEKKVISQLVVHLRETGSIYRRTRVGNFIRSVLRLFRA